MDAAGYSEMSVQTAVVLRLFVLTPLEALQHLLISALTSWV